MFKIKEDGKDAEELETGFWNQQISSAHPPE
jgi:hypothetical protein